MGRARAKTGSEAVPPPSLNVDGHQLRGIVLVVAATFLFACTDASTKYLVAHYEVPLVAGIRYIVHTLLMLAILAPRQGRKLIETHRRWLVVTRAVCLVAASLFMGLALQRMPIAESTAISYLSPILVVLLARPFLGERIGFTGWLAALGGFLGVLLIVRPGGGLDPLGVGFALCNMAVTAAYYLLSRHLARTERTLALLFYAALVGTIGFGLAMPWFWFRTVPSPVEAALLLSLGITAGFGHFLFTAANRYAPASLLAPTSYMQLLWAGLLGLAIFGQFPDGPGLLGMSLIGLAGIIVALRARSVRP